MVKRYCEENEIKMKKIILKTPQQNEVVERINRILNEHIKSMRLHLGLSKIFWVEVISTVVYLINRGSSEPLNCKILEEIWINKKLKLSYLKVFGCLSYNYIDFALRNKLDPKSKKYSFIDYNNIKFDYYFWDDKNYKIIRSKDVIFNESVMYKDSLEKNIKSLNFIANESKMVHLKDFSMIKS